MNEWMRKGRERRREEGRSKEERKEQRQGNTITLDLKLWVAQMLSVKSSTGPESGDAREVHTSFCAVSRSWCLTLEVKFTCGMGRKSR